MVIAILALLALIAIPAYTQYKKNAAISACESSAKVVYDAALVSDATATGGDDDGSGWTAYAKIGTGLTATPSGSIKSGTFKVTVTDGDGNSGQFPQS